MSTVQIQAQLTTDELLKAVQQLNLNELNRFTSQVISLRAQRQAPSLPHKETTLLQKINRGLPEKLQWRYHELIAKRQAEALTAKEYEELLDMTDQVENLEAERVQYLGELAKLRKISLSDLMQQLNIPAVPYV